MIRASIAALVLGGAPLLLAQTPTPDTLFATAQAAHGGDAVTGVDRIRLTGRSSIDGGAAQAITITAGLDGRLRVDYGDPVQRSIVTTTSGRSEVRNGKKTVKPAHDAAYSQLDFLSIFGVRHLAIAVSRTALGPGSINGRATYRVRAATGREMQITRPTPPAPIRSRRALTIYPCPAWIPTAPSSIRATIRATPRTAGPTFCFGTAACGISRAMPRETFSP